MDMYPGQYVYAFPFRLQSICKWETNIDLGKCCNIALGWYCNIALGQYWFHNCSAQVILHYCPGQYCNIALGLRPKWEAIPVLPRAHIHGQYWDLFLRGPVTLGPGRHWLLWHAWKLKGRQKARNHHIREAFSRQKSTLFCDKKKQQKNQQITA